MLPLIDIYTYTYHIDYTMRLPTTSPQGPVGPLLDCSGTTENNDSGCPKAWVPVIG
jgi:hypothetical protein